VIPASEAAGDSSMMGRQDRDQRQLFYEFSLDQMIPTDHLLRRINVFAAAVLSDLHQQLKGFYSDIGRPSVDPELMIRMLLVCYCYGIRHERRLCQEVALHLAYRWFCKLDLDDKVPHYSTFSVNRLGRFRESEILRHIFERVVAACMAAGLVKGPSSAWTAKANKRVQFGYGLNYLIDVEHAIIGPLRRLPRFESKDWFLNRAGRPIEAYLRAAQAYMLISMPADTSTNFGAFQAI
jgi:transposase